MIYRQFFFYSKSKKNNFNFLILCFFKIESNNCPSWQVNFNAPKQYAVSCGSCEGLQHYIFLKFSLVSRIYIEKKYKYNIYKYCFLKNLLSQSWLHMCTTAITWRLFLLAFRVLRRALSCYELEFPLEMFLVELTLGRRKLRRTAYIIIEICFFKVRNDQIVNINQVHSQLANSTKIIADVWGKKWFYVVVN